MNSITPKDAQKKVKDEAIFDSGDSLDCHPSAPKSDSRSAFTLHDSVTGAMNDYFSYLDGELATDVYQMVMTQVESALLASVMEYVKGNQSKAAACLGMSRGTLLKKLTLYKLHPCKK